MRNALTPTRFVPISLTDARDHFTCDGRLRRRTLMFSVPISTQTDGVWCQSCTGHSRGGGGSAHASPNNFLNRTPTKTGLQVCGAAAGSTDCGRVHVDPAVMKHLSLLSNDPSAGIFVRLIGSLSLILSSSPQTGESTSFTQASKTPFFPPIRLCFPGARLFLFESQPNGL